jgi:hypothetical protein
MRHLGVPYGREAKRQPAPVVVVDGAVVRGGAVDAEGGAARASGVCERKPLPLCNTQVGRDADKSIDPRRRPPGVSPSAALDLADRIHKRQRAHQLITQAQQASAQQIHIYLINGARQINLATTDPDHVLDLATTDNDKERHDQPRS